jgi:TPR repeat protein
MKRTLSSEQLPKSTELSHGSNTPAELPAKQAQSEPVLSNRAETNTPMEIVGEPNKSLTPTGEHSEPETSNRSTSASSSTASNNLLSTLNEAAWSGNVESQSHLGKRYLIGDGVEASKEQAHMWFRMAAMQGHLAAQVKVGEMYYKGEGVAVDMRKAFEWYQTAADRGDAGSQFNLAVMYYKGEGAVENKEKAFAYFLKAAEQGFVAAQYSVGMAYYRGEGVEKNKKNAFTWLQKVAELNRSSIEFNTKLMYEYGAGIDIDEERAFTWFHRTAKQGIVVAQFNLGVMCASGEGVEVDDKKALFWTRRAADEGHPQAQFNLGVMYSNGEGVEKSEEKAFKYFLKAAQQGHHKAQRRVSECLQKGIGVVKDLPLAAYWLLKSLRSTIYTSSVVSLDHHSELIKLFPSILKKYSEFKYMDTINFYSDKDFFDDQKIATIAEFIRSNCIVTDLEITYPASGMSNAQFSLLIEALKVNTQLQNIEFIDTNLSDEMAAQIEALLTQNRNILELLKYVEDHPLINTFDIPLDVIKILDKQIIVSYLKSGQTKEATKKAIDEFFLIVRTTALAKDSKTN